MGEDQTHLMGVRRSLVWLEGSRPRIVLPIIGQIEGSRDRPDKAEAVGSQALVEALMPEWSPYPGPSLNDDFLSGNPISHHRLRHLDSERLDKEQSDQDLGADALHGS